MGSQSISLESINNMRSDFQKSSKSRALQNVVCKTDIKQLALNWERASTISHTFSDRIERELPATLSPEEF